MAWNLLIYRPGANDQTTEPPGPLDEVTAKLNATFPELVWDSSTECGMKVEGGFLAGLTLEDDLVSDIYTHGGYNHLKPPGMKSTAGNIGLNQSRQATPGARFAYIRASLARRGCAVR